MALGRKSLLTPAQLERGMVLGEASRLQRKLRLGRPVTLAAIGASNTVRMTLTPTLTRIRTLIRTRTLTLTLTLCVHPNTP